MLYDLAQRVVASPQAMHIPDGYLSPVTAAILFLLVIPFWMRGFSAVKQKMNQRTVPLVALLSAFSFVIMMFNVPLPGGTSGHAVGGALAAIILGPEIATVAISVALLIQALFFGDGGITAYGANCFNMAVVLPYVSYGIYQLIARKTPLLSGRRPWAAAIAGYVGLSVSALVTGVEFGLQPLLFQTANGTPLYAPYPLSIALPAMVIPHLLVASVIEAAVSGLVVIYLQRSNPALLEVGTQAAARLVQGFKAVRPLWVVLVLLALLTPLGLLAPGTAWGEWGAGELSHMGLGFVPAGLAGLEGLWGAPLAGYELPVLGNANLGYVLSAVLGILLVTLVVWLFMMLLVRRPQQQPAPEPVRRTQS